MRKRTRTSLGGVALLVALAVGHHYFPELIPAPGFNEAATQSPAALFSEDEGGYATLQRAVEQRRSEVWFEPVTFDVVKVLADDLKGSRHQRLLVAREGLPTLLVAHNIDLAPRVPYTEGDRLTIKGRYEWNDKGGVIHWTHHDPQRRQPGGWIELAGKRYE